MNPRKKFIIFIIFIIASFIISTFSGYFGLNPTSTIEKFINLNPNFSSLIYTILFIILTSFAFSVSVMTSLGAMFFSTYEVIIFSMIGIMGSSIIHFYLSRKLGREYVRNYIHNKGGDLEKFDVILEKDSFKTIFLLSAIFFVPPSIPNFLGGVIKINLKKFSIATFLGNVPNTVFTVLLINGFMNSNNTLVIISIIGLILVTSIALIFYSGEIKDILVLSFPWMFNRKMKIP